MNLNYYSAYDFLLQSELSLPLSSVARALEPGATIAYGAVAPDGLQHVHRRGLTYQANPVEFWLQVPAVARFMISRGKNIIIEPDKKSDEDSIRAFVLNVCMEILLRQRQLKILPGYALKRGDDAVAFAGHLHGGSSLLQGLFYQQGHTFMGGNVVVLNSQAQVLPGPAQLEFVPPVVSALNLEVECLKAIRPGIKKYIVPLQQQHHAQPLPLKIVYIWKVHQQNTITCSELEPVLMQRYLQQMGQMSALTHCYPQTSWDAVGQSIPMVCISVPEKGLKVHQLADFIKCDLEVRGVCHV